MSEPKTKRRLSEMLGRDLVQVYTDKQGLRYIWMLGYGFRDPCSSKGYTWVHFHFNVLPLAAFLERPGLDGNTCNRLFNNDAQVDTEELDRGEIRYYYSDPETEEPTPFFVSDWEIPDGYYIV